MGQSSDRNEETLIEEHLDYRSGVVGFYQHDLNHLKDHHPEMVPHLKSIVESIQKPDKVCYDLSEFAGENNQNFYLSTQAISNPKLCIKTTISYDDGTWTRGHFVTSHKVSLQQKEKEPIANTIYERNQK